ncbi:MAG: TIGR03089 family protein [Streptosporangiaceae bacterium]
MELKRSAPLVTFYDDAVGERLEFSRRTFDNWVDKTANLLVDGLDAQPGDKVLLDLPLHWQTAVWFFACWKTGLEVRLGEGDCAFHVTTGDRLPADSRAEVVGLSLNAFGEPLADAPSYVVDYATEVRAYGDRFVAYRKPDLEAPALSVTNATFTANQLNQLTLAAIAKYRLTSADRTLVTTAWSSAETLVSALLAPVEAGGSVILCRNIDLTLVTSRLETERVTALAGLDSSYDSVRRIL